jgi:GT2 family glycosyltransferase
MKSVTGLTVFYKTPHLVDISIKAFRKYYPDTALIVVNNSPEDDECTTVLRKTLNKWKKSTKIIQLDKNYGHGPGLNRGMQYVKTPYVYIFDSDTEIIKEDLLESMLSLMDSHTYGVGFTRLTSRGGSHRDGGVLSDPEVMTYLHPLACVISMHQYEKFPKFYSGGAPFNKTMSAIKDTGNAEMLIKFFPVILGGRLHANYVKHGGGNTRARYGICSPYQGE